MTTPARPRLDAGTLALLTFPPIFWAGNAIVGRMAAGLIAPMALNALRWAIAGVVLLPFVWRLLPAHRVELRAKAGVILALGILGMGSYNALQYLALTTSSATNVTLIAASGPMFTLTLGALFFGETVTGRRVAGALVSLAGVVLVMLRGDWTHLENLNFVPGDLFMLGAAATWSLYTWLLRIHRPALPASVLLFAQIATGLAFCIGCALLERYGFGVTSRFDEPKAWWVLAYVGILPSVVGYLFWDRGVARAGATLPVFFANLIPVVAAVLSALLLAEWPQWYHAAGLAFIVVGITLAR